MKSKIGALAIAAAALVACGAAAPQTCREQSAEGGGLCSDTEGEQVYQARLDALTRSGLAGSGEASYAPQEVVPGLARPTPLRVSTRPGLSVEARNRARDYVAARNSSALIIWRDGAIEQEDYFGTTSATTPIVSRSLAKPVTALLIGRAIQQGFIKSLDQPVADFIYEWRYDPLRSRMTIRQVLGMRSGLLSQAVDGGPGDMLYRAYLHPRHDEIIIKQYPLTDPPGSRYEYSNANGELIAPIIERATGQRYASYLSSALLKPLGAAGGSVWINRPGGMAHSGCCLMLPPRSWLRMAVLLIEDGVWQGRRLLPKGYVTAMRTPDAVNPHYGLGVWVAGPYLQRRGYANPALNIGKVLHSEPYLDRGLYLFDGNSNQVAYIVPSLRLVVLRTGATPPRDKEWDNAFLPNLLIRDLHTRRGLPLPVPQ